MMDTQTTEPTELDTLRTLSGYLDSATEVPGYWTVSTLMGILADEGIDYHRMTLYRLLHAANVKLFRAGNLYLIEARAAVGVLITLRDRHAARTHGGK